MAKRKRVVWVIMHYEYMGCADDPCLDALQFHVSSTLAQAEAYIHRRGVQACSWWQVHPHTIDTDDFDEGEEVYYYSHRGTRLKVAPHARALAAFYKLAARYPELHPKSAKSQQGQGNI